MNVIRKFHLRAVVCLAGAISLTSAVIPTVSATIRPAVPGTVTDIANPDTYTCTQPGFVGFEDIPAATTLTHRYIPGIDFTTSGSFTWHVGDFAAGADEGTKFPAGTLTSEQTHWATTDVTSGRIDLLGGNASTFSTLVKTDASVTLEGHASNGSVVSTVGPSTVPAGRHMIEVKLADPTADIAYVIVIVTGGSGFTLDSVCTDAPGVPTGQLRLSSADGPPTSNITVTGHGFGPNETVDISINNCFNGLATANQGSFTIQMTICSTVESGPATIVATGETSGVTGTANYLVHTDWPQLALNAARTGFNRHENTLGPGSVGGLHVVWHPQTGGRPTAADVVQGVVYTSSANNAVYAFNEVTGDRLWFFTTGGTLRAAPAVDKGRVFVASGDKKVYALDAGTGLPVWSQPYNAGAALNRAPLFVKNVLYLGADNGNVYALNEATGAQVWKVSLNTPVHSTLATDGTLLFVGTDSGTLFALDRTTGKTVWQKTTGGMIRSSPAVAGGKVYVGSADGFVWAWNASTGVRAWRHPTGLPVGAPPAAAFGLVFVGDQNGKLLALSQADGHELWNFPTGQSITSRAAVANGVVYVASASQNLYAVSLATGAPLLTPLHVGLSPTEITVTNGAVYVGSEDHVLYKFGL